MQRIFLAAMISVTLFACNNHKTKETTITSEDGKEKVTVDVTQMQNAAKEMEKKKEELENLTPLSTDQLKAMIPATILGGKQTSIDANSSMGAVQASGEYEINDSTTINLNIIDCAGSGGAGIYSLQYLGMLNVQEDNDDEYTKTIDFNGSKAFEHCDKASNDCTITYFAGGRFLVALQGAHIGAPALREAASHLNIK
jgi:hypothetical protein